MRSNIHNAERVEVAGALGTALGIVIRDKAQGAAVKSLAGAKESRETLRGKLSRGLKKNTSGGITKRVADRFGTNNTAYKSLSRRAQVANPMASKER